MNRKTFDKAVRLMMAGVSVLLCCVCLLSLYQSRTGYDVFLPIGSLGSLCFSALACGGVAAVCIRSFFVKEGHQLASSQFMPWLVLAGAVAAVLCLASIIGNMALRQILLG